MNIERITWDSQFFGFEIGRLWIKDPVDAGELRASLDSSPFDVVYLSGCTRR